MPDTEENRRGAAQQDAQKTYQTLQDIHRAWDNADDGDKLAKAAEEYFADSTYRQSEEAQTTRKMDRALSAAALLAADYHTASNAAAFDELPENKRAELWEEFRSETRDSLRQEIGDYAALGYDEKTLAKQGYIDYKYTLEQSELDNLQAWLASPNPAADPKLANVLEEMNKFSCCHFDLTNMAVARTQVTQVLADKYTTSRVQLSQNARNAAEALSETVDEVSAVTKSRVMDTIRTKRLEELKGTDKELQKFMEQHPNASAKDWRQAIQRSKDAAAGKTTTKRFHEVKVKTTGKSRHSLDPKAAAKAAEELEPVFSEAATQALEETFDTFGEVTESTGFFTRNAAVDVSSFLLGDLGSAVRLTSMGVQIGGKAYDIAYNRWLEKSKNAKTQNYRESLSAARKKLRSNDVSVRYEGRTQIKDLRREHRYEKIQTRRHGDDRSKWKPMDTKHHKKFDETFKAKALAKINNSKLGKKLGKVFNTKRELAKAVTHAGVVVVKGAAVAFATVIFPAGIIVTILLTLLMFVLMPFLSLFSFLEPKYAQNCINNLNALDEAYVRAVKNELVMHYAAPDDKNKNKYTNVTIYESPDYHTNILLDTTRVGQFIDEYGNPIASGNNILPIFMAFRYRTGCDITRETYVAAAAYAQMMYWRTHSVNIEEGKEADQAHLEFKRDDCGKYEHTGTAKNRVPYNTYINATGYEVTEFCNSWERISDTITCRIAEHTHSDGCYSNILVCDGGHVHGPDCFTDDSNDITITGGMVLPVADCGIGEHIHGATCYVQELSCTKQEHTHDSPLEMYKDGVLIGWTTNCYTIETKCLGHCPGHMEAQYTIQVVTDIENIVKYDDFIFTEDAMTYGENVLQHFLTNLGKKEDEFFDAVKNKWNGLLGRQDTFNREDLYYQYINTITYGGYTINQFKNYGDNNKKAVFYSNASLYTYLVNNGLLPEVTNGNWLQTFYRAEENYSRSMKQTNLRFLTRLGMSDDAHSKLLAQFQVNNASRDKLHDSTKYLSPFLFDGFQTNGKYMFRNGWGFYPCFDVTHIGDWVWCIDNGFLTAVTGTYEDGYQYAVDAFYEESKLVFSNAVPGADVNTLEDENLKKAVKALQKMADSYPEEYRKSPEVFQGVAFKYLVYYINNGTSSTLKLYDLYAGNDNWYENCDTTGSGNKKKPVFSVGIGKILSRKSLQGHEWVNDSSSWSSSNTYEYYNLYVAAKVGNKGNYLAGENYYYCLVYAPEEDSMFRFVTMSETDLNLYERSATVIEK